MAFLGTIIVIALCVGLSVAIAAICNGVEKRMENKRKKAHPNLFKWFEECEEKGSEAVRWHNSEITPRKRKIDTIINEMPYYPAAVKAEKEAELEDLRNAVYLAKLNDDVLTEELKEVRTRIHNYVEEHNLKWAKNRGW